MTYREGDKVRIVPPEYSISRAREGWTGTIIDVDEAVVSYNVQFADKSTDWYFATWLKPIDDRLDSQNLIANMINDAPNRLNIIQPYPYLLPCGCCDKRDGELCSQYK